ncbi:unnamed protein product [Spirodela intermedia]|uniref:Uncharacterized protein n=1 Tax=Spirodela intermedia TaxID=51605 RepID=A0A7I8JNZ6_SPIIN|nr:unnamed protein product [Spirodela intermedia]CAA6671898.1 unnamed protein product [Spirodela intermedia]
MGKHTATPAILFFGFLLVIGASSSPSFSADGIDQKSSLRAGLSLFSSGGSFQLGFFNLGVPAKRYLCIRFNRGNEKPVVWVANRDSPLNGSDGILRFGGDGNLVLVDKAGNIAWSTNLNSSTGGNRVARLLETGNFVIHDAGRVLWESFDEPGDTLLPHLTSWKANDDPSPGKYSYRLVVEKLPTCVLLEGSKLKFTPGMWNGVRFTGSPFHNANNFFNSSVVSSGDEVYYSDSLIAGTSSSRLVLTPTGELKRYAWSDEGDSWTVLWTVPWECQDYGQCGPYSTCTVSDYPHCRCLRGFRPKSQEDWFQGNCTGGCVRNTALRCGASDGFRPVVSVKLPELLNATVTTNMSLEDCRARCANSCNCTAYGSGDIRQGGRVCVTWEGDLVDIVNFTFNGQELFLRVADANSGTYFS